MNHLSSKFQNFPASHSHNSSTTANSVAAAADSVYGANLDFPTSLPILHCTEEVTEAPNDMEERQGKQKNPLKKSENI